MAYQTGSASDINDLRSQLATFASGQGWTIVKNTTDLLFLSKGICFVAMQAFSYNYNDFATGVSVSKSDRRFDMTLATSLNAALNTAHGHPGSLMTVLNDQDRVCVNNLLGPFPEYHFFTGGVGDPDYIMVSVKTGANTWRQFGFGMIDKGDFTHSGAAFLSGNCGHFYSNQSSVLGGSNWFNQIDRAPIPFARNLLSVANLSEIGFNLYVPDALPNTAAWATMRSGFDAASHLVGMKQKPSTQYPNTSTSPNPYILNPFMASPPTTWGGNVMLFTIPVICPAPSISKQCYIGDYPGVRLLNMEGLQSGQILTLGADEWQVFSVGRQTPWMTQSEAGNQYTTGQTGLAFKKNV